MSLFLFYFRPQHPYPRRPTSKWWTCGSSSAYLSYFLSLCSTSLSTWPQRGNFSASRTRSRPCPAKCYPSVWRTRKRETEQQVKAKWLLSPYSLDGFCLQPLAIQKTRTRDYLINFSHRQLSSSRVILESLTLSTGCTSSHDFLTINLDMYSIWSTQKYGISYLIVRFIYP